MNPLNKVLTSAERKLLVKKPFPEWINPMLATLTQSRFSHPNWLYECKFDGIRALILKTAILLR